MGGPARWISDGRFGLLELRGINPLAGGKSTNYCNIDILFILKNYHASHFKM